VQNHEVIKEEICKMADAWNLRLIKSKKKFEKNRRRFSSTVGVVPVVGTFGSVVLSQI